MKSRVLCPCSRFMVITVVLTSVTLLQACGGGGGGDKSSSNPPPAADTPAPTAPANVVANAASDTRIDLSWSAATDAGGSNLSGYQIYRDGSATVLATVTAPTTT